MPVRIVRNDIVNMWVEAIVNTANPRPVIGSGVDSAIHAAAGPRLLEARKQIGNIRVGSSAVTSGFDLRARYVIHTAGPVWRGGLFGEERKLRECYDSALRLAAALGLQSIAFPLVSTGNYRFPKEKALQIATAAFNEFLAEYEMEIYLVVFGQEAFHLSEELFHSVSSYIDEHYVEEKIAQEYGSSDWDVDLFGERDLMANQAAPIDADGYFVDDGFGNDYYGEAAAQRGPVDFFPEESRVDYLEVPVAAPAESPRKMSLEDLLAQTDAGFTETLLQLIDKSGKKDSQIYKKANLSKQHFSKIRKNPAYKPTKPTALALALALELNLEETKDLIGRAGYALTNSSKFDLIIRYFIERGNYDVMEINMALYEFDQNLLGA